MTSNTIVFITGANTGLGLEIVKSLYQSSTDYTILLGGRSIDKANAAAKEVQSQFPSSRSAVETVQIDIENDDSINQAFEHVSTRYGRVDVLINNAGALFDPGYMQDKIPLRETWNRSWNVNVTGTYILTHTFVSLLLKSASPRLLFIASGTSSLTENGNTSLPVNKSPSKGWPKDGFSLTAYRSSKAGLNMVMREFTRILKEDGVKIWSVSPGYLATGLGMGSEMNRKAGALDPSIGADFVRDVLEGKRDGDVGKVIRKNDVQPW